MAQATWPPVWTAHHHAVAISPAGRLASHGPHAKWACMDPVEAALGDALAALPQGRYTIPGRGVAGASSWDTVTMV